MPLKVSQKGWVVIPAELREKYGLEPGSEVHVVDYGGVLALLPAHQDPIEAGAGMLSGGTSLIQALLEEHQKEVERERGG